MPSTKEKNRVFPGRLAIEQRVIPSYRVPFFDMLAHSCQRGLKLFAGEPRMGEGITSGKLHVARYAPLHNIHVLSGPLYFCYQQGLISALADWDPDVLVLEANPRYLSTPAAIDWMHAHGRKVIGWGLGAPALQGALRGVFPGWRTQFIRRFDALIAYSQRGADEYAALGFPRDRIFAAPNAASSTPVSTVPARRGKRDRLSVLFVGRLQERKRVDLLLRACAQMNEPRPRLVIVGDGPERQKLEQLAGQIYPLAQFAGARQGAELRPYFQDADLFVLPGTGGLAVQEAMANGLPVLVGRGDGTQDDLVRPADGWQIRADDYELLASTLRVALSDVKRLRKMGRESRRIVSTEINLEKMVEGFVTALNSLK